MFTQFSMMGVTLVQVFRQLRRLSYMRINVISRCINYVFYKIADCLIDQKGSEAAC